MIVAGQTYKKSPDIAAQATTTKKMINTNGAGSTTATTPTSTTSGSKEKRTGWFHSLTRRKKSPVETNGIAPSSTVTTPSNATADGGGDGASVADDELTPYMLNNNNEPLQSVVASAADETNLTAVGRKRKEEKNVFQRLRKKMGLRFHSLRHRRHHSSTSSVMGATTDASSEFFACGAPETPQLNFSFANDTGVLDDPSEMVPFTHDYHRFIAKKWLNGGDGPNRVMYRACTEMISQVWYWGEISRRNAQRVLSDKPTGSFLVRDSESSGCQFTLSFRIINVTLHYRIEYRDNYWHFEELQYESIVEMIEDILRRCTNDNFICFVRVPNEMQPPFPVILKYPLSRYFRMPQLQDLCRRVLQGHATPADISKLPVPPTLLEYLSEQRELVF